MRSIPAVLLRNYVSLPGSAARTRSLSSTRVALALDLVLGFARVLERGFASCVQCPKDDKQKGTLDCAHNIKANRQLSGS